MTPGQQTLALSQLLDRAIALHQRGNFDEADRLYRQVLNANADHFEARHLFGVLRAQQGRHSEALDLIAAALKAKPDYVEALYNRGNVLSALRRYEEALADYDRTLAINPGNVEAYLNRGNVLLELKQYAAALASYDAALAIMPEFAPARDGRGNALLGLKRYAEALASYDAALAARYVDAGTFNNRGNALKALKRNDEALASYDQALSSRPDFVDALTNRGTLLKEIGRYDEAIASFDRALSIESDSVDAFGGLADLALGVCDWNRAGKIAGELKARISAGQPSVSPMTLLAYCDDPSLQLACARRYIADRIPIAPPQLWNGTPFRNARPRVAYLSGDFRRHPVSYAAVELFERHDRSKFEIVGISFGTDDHSDIRARVVRAFDQFYDVRQKADREVAQLLNDLHVDIAIDLTGYTLDCRPELLAHRPAPIQVSYLGYPGTMGASFQDYIIADAVALPFDLAPFYAEKIVHLPGCFLPRDVPRKRMVPTRRDAGLPEHGFVFGCFNGHWKIAAPVFEIWMRLLKSVDGSILWLAHGHAAAVANLRRAADAGGVDPSRLIIAPRIERHEDHLARLALIDLFLDTLPYNAHVTAGEALGAGVPVLTCRGRGFAARIAASLVLAAGLPELVTQNLQEYEATALRLASEGACLSTIRQKLAQALTAGTVFDVDRFRRNIEAAYARMWDIWQRGERPKSFAVDD